MSDQGSASSNTKEIRIAIVLYGGVSLAVYENGVTRSFYDFVKGNGVFKILLGLLDAKAVVDVIAGTSAGGINGLFLGAALEADAEFADTSALWREHGDFGKLLRPITEADDAESLLQGETYYQDQLFQAYDALLQQEKAPFAYQSEMDIFITGTDFYGKVKTFRDSAGHKIQDKSYRTVFHLKYRPGRRRLGLSTAESMEESPDKVGQAAILASISRITSCFPAAFPPFQIDQIKEEHRAAVREGLNSCAIRGRGESTTASERTYVDGGVLDNKPFGHVLNSVFHRMPSAKVDRRLFFLEPDPQTFREAKEGPEVGAGDTSASPNPLGVALSCLTSIPAHEGISADLDKLHLHNCRTRWLTELKERLLNLESLGRPIERPALSSGSVYHANRVESLVRGLLMDSDQPPSAQTDLGDGNRAALSAPLKNALELLPTEPEWRIDHFDVDYQLRLVFYALYLIHAKLEKSPEAEGFRRATAALGRIVKLLKIIRYGAVSLRKSVEKILGKADGGEPEADPVFKAFSRLFAQNSKPWAALCEALEADFTIADLADRDRGPLSSAFLTDTNEAAQEIANSLVALGDAEGEAEPAEQTVLQAVALATDRTIQLAFDGTPPFGLQDLRHVDAALFPIQFATGLYELDLIEFTRLSPKDAQIGLSRLDARDKVSGDELAHFSAFLRQDWRSNDILWGRLDSICQIIDSFLDFEAAKGAISSGKGDAIFLEGAFRDMIPSCPPKVTDDLAEAWAVFRESPTEELFQPLKESLILAGQHDAAHDDLEDLFKDLHQQEIVWDKQRGPDGETSASAPAAIERAAAEKAEKSVKNLRSTRGDKFKSMAIGGQAVTGPGGVPANILGEYVTKTLLLLWGMLTRATGGKESFLNRGSLRLYVRGPIRFLWSLLFLTRTQHTLAPLVLSTLAGALIAIGVVAALLGHLAWAICAALALGVVLFVTTQLTSRVVEEKMTWVKWISLLGILLLIGLTGLAIWYGGAADAVARVLNG